MKPQHYSLPIRTVSTLNSREHWRVRHERNSYERHAIAVCCSRAKKFPLPAVVTLTRVAFARMDGDNLQASFKAIRDQLAELLGADDGSDAIEWRYAQQKAKRGTHAIEVLIEQKAAA